MIQELERLNNEQRQVVTTLDQNMLVIAPAGTGKTRVIALKTAYLLQQGIPPSSILCLTFTNKAAKEMQERIKEHVKGQIKELTIKTFHSFCYEIIKNEKKYSHFSFGATILDEADTMELLEKIRDRTSNAKIRISEIQHFIEEIKKYSLSLPKEKWYDYPLLVKSYLKEYKVKDKDLLQYGLMWFKTYQKQLIKNNCMDFTDLIVEASYLMEEDAVLKRWQNKYQIIQVDEMQDTSKREYALLKKLATHAKVSLFGDFNQTIYEWRGSNPAEMLEDFREKFAPIEIALHKNYRSTKRLLDAANQYIRNSSLYPLEVGSVYETYGEPIEIFAAATKREEFEAIARSLLLPSTKKKPKAAVLVRTNAYAKEAYKELSRLGISCLKVEEIKLFRKKEVKDFLAYFSYQLNARNNRALEAILVHPFFQIEPWLLLELKKSEKAHLTLHDWFSGQEEVPYEKLFKAYEKNKIVVLDVESTGLDTTKDEIIQIAAILFGKDGVSKKLDVLVKPTRTVGDSFYVHGFTDRQLQEEGLQPIEALEKLRCFCKGSIVVGHNVQYDLQMIQSMFSRYDLEPFLITGVYDTLDLSRKVFKDLANYTLENVAKFVQTTNIPNHNALADILATAEVLDACISALKDSFSLRFSYKEQLDPYVLPYKKSLHKLLNALENQTTYEVIEMLMNQYGFKTYYTQEQLVSLRDFYKVVKALYEEGDSFEDNQIRLLAFCALHYNELEQTPFFKDKLPIMTVHQAKGLEFEHVYIAGCNERIFPSARSVKEGFITEEKRLFYVALTRAKERLFLSYTTTLPKSYFLEEIGEDFVFVDKKMLNSNKKDRNA